MFTRSFAASVRLTSLAVLLAGSACSSDPVKPNPTPPNYGGLGSGGPGDPSAASRLGGEDSGVVFNSGKINGLDQTQAGIGSGIGVNAFLWRGALDTIGFMPLISADPFGGVIITDWYTPPGASGERFKASVYVLGRDLRSDGVRLNINRQVLDNGQWVDAPVAASTVADIENKMLARARRMREQLQAGG
ncbi:MAG TPA: DUF3576 domain-containing protein [Rhodopila sp.]|jgi:hypothetical protein